VDLDLTGRRALVTGGSRGIGKAVARALADEGVHVAIAARDLATLGATASELSEMTGGRVVPVRIDTGDTASVEAGVAEAVELLGGLDILVNNAAAPAGQSTPPRLAELSDDVFWDDVNVKVLGYLRCARAAEPHLRANGWGRIVNISSSSAQRGSKNMVAYSASKGAMIVMTRSLALELGAHGITVNNIPPGFIDTPMLRETAASGHLGPNGIEAQIAATPVGRPGRPEDMAAMCAFLVSEEAGYITGQTMGVNGGRVTS